MNWETINWWVTLLWYLFYYGCLDPNPQYSSYVYIARVTGRLWKWEPTFSAFMMGSELCWPRERARNSCLVGNQQCLPQTTFPRPCAKSNWSCLEYNLKLGSQWDTESSKADKEINMPDEIHSRIPMTAMVLAEMFPNISHWSSDALGNSGFSWRLLSSWAWQEVRNLQIWAPPEANSFHLLSISMKEVLLSTPFNRWAKWVWAHFGNLLQVIKSPNSLLNANKVRFYKLLVILSVNLVSVIIIGVITYFWLPNP